MGARSKNKGVDAPPGHKLTALDDVAALPNLSKTSLAHRIGFTGTTVRHTLRRFATIGQELIQASDDERRAYLTPVLSLAR